jgi:hypothetical protein
MKPRTFCEIFSENPLTIRVESNMASVPSATPVVAIRMTGRKVLPLLRSDRNNLDAYVRISFRRDDFMLKGLK